MTAADAPAVGSVTPEPIDNAPWCDPVHGRTRHWLIGHAPAAGDQQNTATVERKLPPSDFLGRRTRETTPAGPPKRYPDSVSGAAADSAAVATSCRRNWL